MPDTQRARFIRHMRGPAWSFLILIVLLACIVALGATRPFHGAFIVEAMLLLAMVATVLLVSMEVLQEPPVTRVFAALGFFWVLILFAMTLTDYLAR